LTLLAAEQITRAVVIQVELDSDTPKMQQLNSAIHGL